MLISFSANPKKRGYLLPPGCKDLIDVMKQTSKEKTPGVRETVAIHPISTEHVFGNGKIRAREVRVCDQAGVVLGIFQLGDALVLARSRELDLVLIDARIQPHLCVLIDYGKYRWQESKKKTQVGAPKGQRQPVLFPTKWAQKEMPVIHLPSRVVVRGLAAALGVKLYHMIRVLKQMDVFTSTQQQISIHVAAKVARKYGYDVRKKGF